MLISPILRPSLCTYHHPEGLGRRVPVCLPAIPGGDWRQVRCTFRQGADGVPSAPEPEKGKRWGDIKPHTGSPYRQVRGSIKRGAVLRMKK